jgi:DNA repair exonuclease SbcCD ATPase subunit
MRFIVFKRLEGKNFLSFGDEPVKVNLRPGVNAIVGINHDKEDSKNGVGKSSVLELLYYGLYGTTLREIPKDYISNSFTKKRCEVSLEFDVTSNNAIDSYKIVRKLNPTKCYIFKNDEDVTRSTLAKTNGYIQDLIRTPATVFRNSVIMSVNTALPFMALPKTDKRKFIESVLGLEVFTQMVLRARDDYSIAKKDYEIAYSKFEQQQLELSFNDSQFNNYETVKQERILKLSVKQANIKNDISKTQTKFVSMEANDLSCSEQELEKNRSDLDLLHEKTKELHTKVVKVQTEINSEQKQINQLQHNKDKCPTCSRDYSEEHVDHVSQLIATHNDNISKLSEAEVKIAAAQKKTNEKVENLQQLIKENKTKRRLVEQQIAENKHIQTSLSFLKNSLKETEDEIELVKKEQNNDLKGKITTLKLNVDQCKATVDKLNNELNVLETVKFVISEEGIKSFIVKKILKILNSRLALYLKKLETNCLCQFNEFFDEVIVDENAQQKSYFNFSGGERKRIDLACLFAFADIRRLQGDVNFSTVFYDELLDSSLDDKGVSLTLRLLRERFQENNEACYIITHRGPEVTTKAEHTIHVTKRNGITTVSC